MAVSANNPEKKQLNIKTITFGDLTWVDITDPTEDITKYLTEKYNFHPMDIEDALKPQAAFQSRRISHLYLRHFPPFEI